MYTEKIEQFFAENTDKMLRDVAALVAVPSTREAPLPGKPFGEGPAKALDTALNIAQAMGFKTRNFDNYAGTIDLGDQPKLAILAHVDVVEAGDGWDTDPYVPVLKDGKLYGRGTSDDKGPAIAALYAMAAARAIEPELEGVRLVLGCAEETGSECMEHYMSCEQLPGMVFSPDAEFPVINIEKGGFAPRFGVHYESPDRAVPGVVSLVGGKTFNIVPGKATAVLRGVDAADVEAAAKAQDSGVTFTVTQEGENVLVLCEGKGAHASTPNEGVNAQTALIKLLCSLDLQGSNAENLKKLAQLFPHGDNCGQALGINISDDISGDLTMTFSVLDMNENGFEAVFDSRVPICGNEDNVAAPVVKKFEEAGFRLFGGNAMRPPHHTPEDSPFVQTLLKSYERFSGLEGKCIAIGGGTYVHEVEGGVAFGCTLPGTDTHMHGANEFTPVEELVMSAKIFTDVILRLCK